MTDRTELLMYARRLHDALKHAIETGDGRTDDRWLNIERPIFEHYCCTMYLAGALAYLEDKYGDRPWNKPGANCGTFNDYISNSGTRSFQNANLSSSKLDALVCIRNAVIHNGGDLARNRDRNALQKVTSESIPNASLNGTIITLHSTNYPDDFMAFVRQAFLAVCMYHGDG